MEGRTIVRPDKMCSSHPSHRECCLQWRAGQSSGQTRRRMDRDPTRQNSFNGGPDKRPARPARSRSGTTTGWHPSMEGRTIVRPDTCGELAAKNRMIPLQWRAGQSSGQTGRCGVTTRIRLFSFNGGPDNRPARPWMTNTTKCASRCLQWRAGQSSGQTPFTSKT